MYGSTDRSNATARRWHTSRIVVRKWLRRFEQQGEQGQGVSAEPTHRFDARWSISSVVWITRLFTSKAR